MSSKNKGTKVAQIALASAVATSIIAVTNSAEAASQKEAEKLVKQAEKLAANLQKEITYESRVKLYPKDKFGLPNLKLYKDTSAALKKAQKEVNKLKGTSKKKLQARLSSKVEKSYNDATAYMNVVKTAKDLDQTNQTLELSFNDGNTSPDVIKLNTKFTEDIKNFNKSIGKLKGTKTKQAFVDSYVNKYNITNKTANYAITINKELDQLNVHINAGEDTQATALQQTIQNRIASGEKLGYIKGNLAKIYESSLTKVAQDIDRHYTYKAESSDAANPTTFGGENNTRVINHDLVVVAGKSQYINVSNIEVNGKIIIKGDETGAGTVKFDHVKVNAVNGTGGEIIVEDVADHSFYIKNVHADKLSIKDMNGGNIVAQEGTNIKELAVVDKAGETGKINLVSQKGSFDQVDVASTGGKTDVVFNGDFSQSKIGVKAPAAQVTLAPGVRITVLDIKSEAKINAQEGASVDTINLAVEQKDQKVELSGSLKDAKVNIANANATVEVARDTVIKEISKDKDVAGDVAITNNGKVENVTNVKVDTPTPTPAPAQSPSQPPSSNQDSTPVASQPPSSNQDSTPVVSPMPAASLTATAELGTTANTTAVTATAATGHNLVYKVSGSEIATPNIGDSVTGTSILTSGADIAGVDVTTHKYLGVYELDGSNKVVKFKLITLQASDIKAAESNVTLKSNPTITTSNDGQKVTFSVEVNYDNHYGQGTVTAEVGNKNGAGMGIGSQVVNDTTGTVTLTKELVISNLAQYKDKEGKVYISIGIKDKNNDYHTTWKTIDTSNFEIPTIANTVSDIANLTIGVDDKGAITGDTATNGGTLKYVLVDASKATQIDSWNVDTTEAEANRALGGTFDATKPTITAGDNTKLLVVAEIKDGKVVAAGQSSAIHVESIGFYPNYSAGFTANENMLTLDVQGNLTDSINTGKIKYMTSETGEKNLTLSGEYHKVDFNTDLKPGEYYYLSSGSDTIVYLKLTDKDANAIKGLEGYGNDSDTINNNSDRLVAESGWYPNAVTGTKSISIYNKIFVTNKSAKEIASTHIFDKNDKEIGVSGTSPGIKTDEIFNMLVNSQATKIVFYEGVYQPNVTPTNGKMKIIQVDENTLNGITLDDSNWINVNESNFGKSEVVDSLTAPTMNVTVEKGFALDATSINYTPDSGNSLAINVTDHSVSAPTIGTDAPAGAEDYESDEDITNVSAGQYVQIYELDSNKKIVKFEQVQLNKDQIQSDFSFQFAPAPNPLNSVAIEFNEALEESVYTNTNVDAVIKMFQITNDEAAFDLNKSNISNIQWDTTNPNHPKLIINFTSNITLSENNLMELGYVEKAVTLDGDVYAYYVDETNGDNLTPLIIKHIKQIAGSAEDSNLADFVSHWLKNLSSEGNIQNYDSSKIYIYQKEIAENDVTDLASLQNVINHANKLELIDKMTAAQDLVDHATVGTEPLNPGEVLQADVEALSSAIVKAQAVVDNVKATLVEVKTALTALQEAIKAYQDAVGVENVSIPVVTGITINGSNTFTNAAGVTFHLDQDIKIEDRSIKNEIKYISTHYTTEPIDFNTLDSKTYIRPYSENTSGISESIQYESDTSSPIATIVLYDQDKNPIGYYTQQVTLTNMVVSKSADFSPVDSGIFVQKVERGTEFNFSEFLKSNPTIKYYVLERKSNYASTNRLDRFTVENILNETVGLREIQNQSSVIANEQPGTSDEYIFIFFDENLKAMKYLQITSQPTSAPTRPAFDMSSFGMNFTNTILMFNAKANEDATGYYVLIPEGEGIPSPEQVKQGNNASNNPAFKSGSFSLGANTEETVTINGLAVGIPYQLVLLAEDTNGNTSDMHVITSTNIPAPAVSADDVNNVLVGATDDMEYSVDGEQTWTKYNSTDVPTFEGNHTVSVRFAEGGAVTNIGFTTNAPELSLFGFKYDYILNEPFDVRNLFFTNAEGQIVSINPEDIKIDGFDSSHYQEAQEVKVTVGDRTETIFVNILPKGPTNLIKDDNLDTIFGLDNTMEFKLTDTGTWTHYTGDNLPDLSGRKDVNVRYFATPNQTSSQVANFMFTDNYFLLNNDAKSGVATSTLTYVWNVGQRDNETLASLENKQVAGLFAEGEDIIHVLGDKDIHITNVTWDNSGQQLKSTFTLADPINMKETLGVSFNMKGLAELDNWVGYNYSALYKASNDELVAALLKELASSDNNSVKDANRILDYMGMGDINASENNEKIVNNYIPSFSAQYIDKLTATAADVHNLSDLQTLINEVNQEQFATMREKVKTLQIEMEAWLAKNPQDERVSEVKDMLSYIQSLLTGSDPTGKTIDQMADMYMQMEDAVEKGESLMGGY